MGATVHHERVRFALGAPLDEATIDRLTASARLGDRVLDHVERRYGAFERCDARRFATLRDASLRETAMVRAGLLCHATRLVREIRRDLLADMAERFGEASLRFALAFGQGADGRFTDPARPVESVLRSGRACVKAWCDAQPSEALRRSAILACPPGVFQDVDEGDAPANAADLMDTALRSLEGGALEPEAGR